MLREAQNENALYVARLLACVRHNMAARRVACCGLVSGGELLDVPYGDSRCRRNTLLDTQTSKTAGESRREQKANPERNCVGATRTTRAGTGERDRWQSFGSDVRSQEKGMAVQGFGCLIWMREKEAGGQDGEMSVSSGSGPKPEVLYCKVSEYCRTTVQ